MSEDDIIHAVVICDDIPKHSDRLHVRKILNDYRYVQAENTLWRAKWEQLAKELDCIPEMEYVMKAVRELKGKQ